MHFSPKCEFPILHHSSANILTVLVLTSMKRAGNIRGSDQVAMPFANFSEVGEGLKFKNVIFLSISLRILKNGFLFYKV